MVTTNTRATPEKTLLGTGTVKMCGDMEYLVASKIHTVTANEFVGGEGSIFTLAFPYT